MKLYSTTDVCHLNHKLNTQLFKVTKLCKMSVNERDYVHCLLINLSSKVYIKGKV